VPSGATVVFAVMVGAALTSQVVLNASLCKIKLVRTFSIRPLLATRVALEALENVKSALPSVGFAQ
jgi:hypothetical protein